LSATTKTASLPITPSGLPGQFFLRPPHGLPVSKYYPIEGAIAMLEYFMMASAQASARSASVDASLARSSARTASVEVERLSRRVEALELAVETIMRMMLENGRIDEKEFLALAKKIDSEDGAVDGRRSLSRMRRYCQNCSRNSPADRNQCMWCGADLSHVKPEIISFRPI
jgi:hypothetical protein